jgi:hypothetical protein
MKKKYYDTMIVALRSGEYKQHHGTLCNDDKTAFCCIGVGHYANNFIKTNITAYAVSDLNLSLEI